jgi:YjbE family integral membrane protein
MNLSTLLQSTLNMEFVVALCSIMLINIVLSGDNAVVIAMAVKSLPRKQRRKGIMFGTAVAVLLRIGLTFIAAQLMGIPFVKLAGGFFIAWIAVKLFVEGAPEEGRSKEVRSVGRAIVTILAADLVMSVDNVLAVAGASKGSLPLLIIGLGMSIPLVIFASSTLSKLMERYAWITYVGAAVLGRVAGEMIMTDPAVGRLLHNPGHLVEYGVEALCAGAVVVAGRMWVRRRAERAPVLPEPAASNPFALPNWDIV